MITRDAVDLDRRFEEAMSGHAVEIARRQADGGWLFVMDRPFGTAAAE